MSSELLRRLGRMYNTRSPRDVWGKREASPKEIADWLHQINSDEFSEVEGYYPPSDNDIIVKNGEKGKRKKH